jgi:hypothetical protein
MNPEIIAFLTFILAACYALSVMFHINRMN